MLRDYINVSKQITNIIYIYIYCFVINFKEIVVYSKLYIEKVIEAKKKYYFVYNSCLVFS